jgi:hypothetical protein
LLAFMDGETPYNVQFNTWQLKKATQSLFPCPVWKGGNGSLIFPHSLLTLFCYTKINCYLKRTI